MIGSGALTTFAQVAVIDLTLAGDNAIVVGLAARGLKPRERGRAILIGTLVATLLRVALALVANRLLKVIGLTLAGGLLLAWVAWKMFREFAAEQRATRAGDEAASASADPRPQKSMRQVLYRIIVADLSMSADNVLAVAGTAREHPFILVFGLLFSIALMAVASTMVAGLLRRWPWLTWLGVAIVAYVSLKMIYQGALQVGAQL
jgi:YjbE family integral membrane protein